MTATLMRNASPRRLKEVLQVLSSNIELVMSDDRLFTTVCDSALASIECDFFLLKVRHITLFLRRQIDASS